MRKPGAINALSGDLFGGPPGKSSGGLHPSIKPLIRQKIDALRENPFLGKALERELTGYYSLKTKKYRVIYRLDHPGKTIQIHYLGYRKDIYDLFMQVNGGDLIF